MKKRVIAVLLSLALTAAGLIPVNAEDFEEQTGVVEVHSEEAAEAFSETEAAADLEVPFEAAEDLTAPEGTMEDFSDEFVMDEAETIQPEEMEDLFASEEAVDSFLTGTIKPGWVAVSTEEGDKYRYLKGTVDALGNALYYTDKDGFLTVNNGKYLFDENGFMIEGKTKYKGLDVYMLEEELAGQKAGSTGKKTPLNSNMGMLRTNYWRWNGTGFEYYGGNGVFLSVNRLKEIGMKNNSYTGYYHIGKYVFCLNEDGTPKTGDVTIKEGSAPGNYYFRPEKTPEGYPGAMAKNTWVKVVDENGTRWRYYNAAGKTFLVGIRVCRLDQTIDPSVGDRRYMLNNEGYIFTQSARKVACDGYTYFCNKQGVVYTDSIVRCGNVRYYVLPNGRLADYTNGWYRLRCAGGRPYYFGSTPGRIEEKYGWVKITTSNGAFYWYYFDGNGNALINKWANNCYFNSLGVLCSGLTEVDGKLFYFRESTADSHEGQKYVDTVLYYNGNNYYAGSDGALYQNQWLYIFDNWYYFQGDGTLLKEGYACKDGVYGYLDSYGIYTTGWFIMDAYANKVRYINPDAPGYLVNTSRVIDGVRYYFDADGYRVSDLTRYYPAGWENDPVLRGIHNGSYAPYYLECDKTNGLITIYTGSDKKIPVKNVRTSVGNPTSLTPSGVFTIHRSSRWQPLMGPSWGQYGTHVVNGIFIHSVACTYANSYNLPAYAYDNLGNPASHGCMRVCVRDAKWIYENCNGARINIYYGGYQSMECNKGPLGRDPLVRRFGSGNFDPTDPAVVG